MTTYSFILPSSTPPAALGMTEETSLADRAVDYLLWQYADQPRVIAMLRALVDAAQPLESLAFDVYAGMRIDTAAGVQLDMLGRIVGEERSGKSDAAYRPFVRAKILVNRCHGTCENLYAICSAIEFDEQWIIEYPHTCYEVHGTGIDYPKDTARFLDQAGPAGVDRRLIYSQETTKNKILSYTSDAVDTDHGLGGAPYDMSVGGYLAGEF